MGLFARKSIAVLQDEAGETGADTLKRVLSASNLTLLGIGAIIGAGIFVLTGTAAAQYAGPAVVYSFMLAGLGCLFAGLCYAEFASMIPIAGSAYTYGYATLGEFVAWIIGWDLMLEYLFGAATVAVGWSGYFGAFLHELGVDLPAAFMQAPFTVEGTHTLVRVPGGMINLPAVVLIVAMTILLVVGIKESARFNNVIVYVKIAIVLLVIGFGFKYVNTANWHPFIPPNTGRVRRVRLARHRCAPPAWCSSPTSASTRCRPRRRRRRIRRRTCRSAFCGSLAICTVLYILMALVMTGVANYTKLNVPHPVPSRSRRFPRSRGSRTRQHRRDRRARVGGAGDAHGPAAHLLLDGARRAAPAGVRQGAPRFRRRTSPRSSPARWRPSSRVSFPSACSASWCRSARCWRS